MDLGALYTIQKVATQGSGTIDRWVTSYHMEYSTDGDVFTYQQDIHGNMIVYTGNDDRDTVVENTIDDPPQARYVRIIPETVQHSKCMRWEVYGCAV